MRILLDKCFLAGWQFGDFAKAPGVRIPEGYPCQLVREPSNVHDTNAIGVWIETDEGNKRLGYIPRASNGALALLLDEGRSIHCEVAVFAPEEKNPWKVIAVTTTLEEK